MTYGCTLSTIRLTTNIVFMATSQEVYLDFFLPFWSFSTLSACARAKLRIRRERSSKAPGHSFSAASSSFATSDGVILSDDNTVRLSFAVSTNPMVQFRHDEGK